MIAMATAPKRDSRHWKQTEVSWDEIVAWMATPSGVKEAGNYLLGTLRQTTVQHSRDDSPCTNLHRGKAGLVSRSAITLDLDTPGTGLLDALELILPFKVLVHTTFQSTPEAPRYRMIIPTDREMKPDEYVGAATAIMALVGPANFDPSSSEAERYMFKPSAANIDYWDWRVFEAPVVRVDTLLEDWSPDLSHMAMPAPPRKRNPFEIEGLVGSFNRAYEDFQVLIEEYALPYVPSAGDRWQLQGSRAVAGMGMVGDGLVYSHHANDPAYGQACTAFDLVRLHRFCDMDAEARPGTPVNKLPSYSAMLDLATQDPRVLAESVGFDFAEDMDATVQAQSYRTRLSLNRQGKVKDEVGNWDIIREHDPALKGIYFNELSLAVETEHDFPWRPLSKGGPTLRNSDRASLQAYLEREYGVQPTRSRVDWMVDETAMTRYRNPVHDWLVTLEWDGVPRVETALPGVDHNEYTRMVARKSLVAAVARVMEPGVKWDHTLILYGTEGLGKTHWIEKMSKGWTAPLGPVHQKDTLINLQRCWIATADEGVSMRKSDADALKEFLTRRNDVFRMPYERESSVHPRHCVIWGTTNDEVFLRDQEGNRRFLIVRCERKVNFDQLTDYYVDQVWAEALHLYRQGEVLLWLDGMESTLAAAHREEFVEEGGTAIEGMVQYYLDTPVPMDWNDRSVLARTTWMQDVSDGFEQPGQVLQDRVCTIQLWVEALGRPQGHHTRMDILELGKALRDLGWKRLPGKYPMGPYGPQQAFERPSELEDLL